MIPTVCLSAFYLCAVSPGLRPPTGLTPLPAWLEALADQPLPSRPHFCPSHSRQLFQLLTFIFPRTCHVFTPPCICTCCPVSGTPFLGGPPGTHLPWFSHKAVNPLLSHTTPGLCTAAQCLVPGSTWGTLVELIIITLSRQAGLSAPKGSVSSVHTRATGGAVSNCSQLFALVNQLGYLL